MSPNGSEATKRSNTYPYVAHACTHAHAPDDAHAQGRCRANMDAGDEHDKHIGIKQMVRVVRCQMPRLCVPNSIKLWTNTHWSKHWTKVSKYV